VIYVFAFVEGDLGAFSVAGEEIEIVAIRGVHVAIQRRDAPPQLSDSTLRRQHDLVIRLGEIVNAILPARFGAFIEPAELDRLVRMRRRELRNGLEHVRGRAQMTIRISDSRVAPPRVPPVRLRSGTAYLVRRKAELEAALPTTALHMLQAAVRDLVADERIDTGQTPGVAALNHLVARQRVGAYRSSIARAGRALDRAVGIRLAGPWPPFAFAPQLWR
jgi:hypothetical protein